jgi:hypothetical protein
MERVSNLSKGVVMLKNKQKEYTLISFGILKGPILPLGVIILLFNLEMRKEPLIRFSLEGHLKKDSLIQFFQGFQKMSIQVLLIP